MEIRVDIDRTLCIYRQVNGKKTAVPVKKVIRRINALYTEGHTITIWSSRNVISRRDQTEFTKNQLKKWGVRYHKMDLTKPLFDLLIDDKVAHVVHWLKNIPTPELGEDFD